MLKKANLRISSRLLFLLLLIFTTATQISCRKKVHKVDELWIGNWYGDGSTCNVLFEVDENSEVLWEKGGSTTDCKDYSLDGNLKIRGNTLRIGHHKFKIHKKPTLLQQPFDQDHILSPSGSFRANYTMEIECLTFCSSEKFTMYRE